MWLLSRLSNNTAARRPAHCCGPVYVGGVPLQAKVGQSKLSRDVWKYQSDHAHLWSFDKLYGLWSEVWCVSGSGCICVCARMCVLQPIRADIVDPGFFYSTTPPTDCKLTSHREIVLEVRDLFLKGSYHDCLALLGNNHYEMIAWLIFRS